MGAVARLSREATHLLPLVEEDDAEPREVGDISIEPKSG
jgi:hypothetical protein